MKSLRKLLSVTISIVMIGVLFVGCGTAKTPTIATKENKKSVWCSLL